MPSLRHPKTALAGAALCLLGLALTGLLAYLSPIAKVSDNMTLQGFIALNRPRVTGFLSDVAHLADPRPYALIGLGLVLVAVVRRRGRVAVAILALLVLTGLTTESLKHVLAHPRFSEWLGEGQIAAASWPSGHATASMTLALCAVLAAPPVLRPTVAAVGALFAIAVSYSILALGWHFPSDVIGGFFVASMWTLVAVAAIGALDARRPPVGERRAATGDLIGPVLIGAGGLVVVAVAAVADPEAVAAFARDHTSFVFAAGGIATLATALAAGLARGVRS